MSVSLTFGLHLIVVEAKNVHFISRVVVQVRNTGDFTLKKKVQDCGVSLPE